MADWATTVALPDGLTSADVLADVSRLATYIPTSGWDARLTQQSIGGRNKGLSIPITSGVPATRKARAPKAA